MSVDLSSIDFRTARPRYRDFGGVLTPPLGGAQQRINRLGNRYALVLELAPIPEEPDGRLATALLQRAKVEGASYPWPQPGLAVGAPGAPEVDGAVAGGTSVPFRGLTANYAIRRGQYFNFIHDGVRYLHHAVAQAIADASGDATVTIHPELRVSLSDGDEIVLAKPLIEGLLEGGDLEWDVMTEPFTGLDSFVIMEAE
jgi:hypothetical protein